MSWSINFTAMSGHAARKHIEEQKEPTPDQPWGLPRYAKNLVLSALDACQLDPNLGVKIEGYGHQPGGGHKIEVTPTYVVT